MTRQKKKTAWEKIRQTAQDIHLWLGLSSGLIIIAICFSGTLYVYNTEIIEMAAPHLYKVKPSPGNTPLSVHQMMENVQTVAGVEVVSVKVPADSQSPYRFTVKKKEKEKGRAGATYLVNPYTGEILGNTKEETGASRFMATMFSLHRWLLLDKIEKPVFSSLTNRELGSLLTGSATLLFTLGCLTGIVIWFPKKLRNWKQGLRIKIKSNWKRINHDLHNTLAFYSLLFLLVMGLTGPQWSFEWYRTGLQKTLGTYKVGGNSGRSAEAGNRKEKRGAAAENKIAPTETTGVAAEKRKKPESAEESRSPEEIRTRLTIEEIIRKADKELPYRGDYTLLLSGDGKEPVNISKTKKGFFASAAADKLSLHATSGTLLKKEIFREKPFNERVAGSIKALHVGNVYGGFTKLLYFLACLVATSLPVTGTLIWVNKLKKRRNRNLSIGVLPQRA